MKYFKLNQVRFSVFKFLTGLGTLYILNIKFNRADISVDMEITYNICRYCKLGLLLSLL
jgi:hypothetical protein